MENRIEELYLARLQLLGSRGKIPTEEERTRIMMQVCTAFLIDSLMTTEQRHQYNRKVIADLAVDKVGTK